MDRSAGADKQIRRFLIAALIFDFVHLAITLHFVASFGLQPPALAGNVGAPALLALLRIYYLATPPAKTDRASQ